MRISNTVEYEVKPGVSFVNNKQINSREIPNNIVKEAETEIDENNEDTFELSEEFKDMLYRQLESMENEKDAYENVGKMMEIARRIANGDRVPASDERALMEYSKEIYESAKMAAMIKKNKDPEEYDSLLEDEEDDMQEKLRALEGSGTGGAAKADVEAAEASGETAEVSQ